MHSHSRRHRVGRFFAGMPLVLAAVLVAALPRVAAAETVTVFAAASTTNALNDIAALFAESGDDTARVVVASSSTLAKQIAAGAPADLFVSANPKWMDFLAERKLLADGSRADLLANSLVLIVPVDSAIKDVDLATGCPLSLMMEGARLALGDPDHVPAGIYAKAALQSLNVWITMERKVVRMKDVRAALTLVERGEATAGIVYATDAAISRKVRVAGRFPADSHPPIVYPAALINGQGGPAAQRFFAFLKGEKASAVFNKYGFRSIK